MPIHIVTWKTSFFVSISVGAKILMCSTAIDDNSGLNGTVATEVTGQTILKNPIGQAQFNGIQDSGNPMMLAFHGLLHLIGRVLESKGIRGHLGKEVKRQQPQW